MAGTAESSSVGTGRSQAEWAGGKPAERMVLGETEGLKSSKEYVQGLRRDLVEEEVYLLCKNS